MSIEDLIRLGYLCYLKKTEQGYPAAGYEVRVDGSILAYFDDSAETVIMYDVGYDIILELDSQSEAIAQHLQVFRVTGVVVFENEYKINFGEVK